MRRRGPVQLSKSQALILDLLANGPRPLRGLHKSSARALRVRGFVRFTQPTGRDGEVLVELRRDRPLVGAR